MPSRGINKVIIVGNLGNDPDIRSTPGGTTVANVSVATSDSWNDKNTGERQERTEWHRVVFFNRLAEIVEQYLKKGSKVYIEGRLQTRSWEQDGIKRYSTEIVANEMQMLDSRGSQGGDAGYAPPYQQASSPAPSQQPEASPASAAATSFSDEVPDDDIPF
ncbi:MAG: single-stranded DNA-binding protein [Gammaproteobacteria bacterium]|nr:single-stranded DNA-binding protein [Gammaproteobacteria bacterium]